MLVRKQKGFKMILNMKECEELESYTLIHLDNIETELFLREANLTPFTGVKTLSYTTGDVLDELFKRFAYEHSFKTTFLNQDNVNSRKETDTEGEWCLIRNPDKHNIYLKPRFKNGNYNTLNRLCIERHQVENFCRDCKRTEHPNHYYLNMDRDVWLYDYWNNYMNSKYLKDRKGTWKL